MRLLNPCLAALLALAASGCGAAGERHRCWVVVERPGPDRYVAPWPHPGLHTRGLWIHFWTGAGEAPGWILQVPWVIWDAGWEAGKGRSAEGLGSIHDALYGAFGMVFCWPLTLAGRTVSYLGGGITGGAAAGAKGILWDLPAAAGRAIAGRPDGEAPKVAAPK